MKLGWVPGCPPDECGFRANRDAERCGEAPGYWIRWDSGRRSLVCERHAVTSRSSFGSHITRIQTYQP
jgi:hypothetical protein